MQTDSVAEAFLLATRTWPAANPSDLWWFIVYRAYCDPSNHPGESAGRDLDQSWKRTGGWALEEVLVRHYGDHLRSRGIGLSIPKGQQKRDLLAQPSIPGGVTLAKVDVVLTGQTRGAEVCFGVVHVKSSFAERRTDDVPLSEALIASGYTSPLWTMDCKSAPSARPQNRGELGQPWTGGSDTRSDKRKDIEDRGRFSACFSCNANTIPTPSRFLTESRVVVCGFRDPDDRFSRFLLDAWDRFKRARA